MDRSVLLATVVSYAFLLTLKFCLILMAHPLPGTLVSYGLSAMLIALTSTYLPDSEEELGGNGLRVACYVRVSTAHQAQEGFSLEAQRHRLEDMAKKLSPSHIYWFTDAGKTGTQFDNRKIQTILELKKAKKIDELWVTDIDRIGRDCLKLIRYFIDFCDEGGKIRTLEREFVPDDLSSLLIYVCEALTTQASNRSRARAAVAGKQTAFQNGRWNKPVPFGYSKVGAWLQKRPELEPVVKELFATFAVTGSLEATATLVNAKYFDVMGALLSRDRVRNLLEDPVYIGLPTHMGTTRGDPALQIVEEAVFKKVEVILTNIASTWRPARKGPFEKLAQEDPMTLLRFLEQVDLVCRVCGGKITKNGIDQKTEQQLFRCSECPRQFRVPTLIHRTQMPHSESPMPPTKAVTTVRALSVIPALPALPFKPVSSHPPLPAHIPGQETPTPKLDILSSQKTTGVLRNGKPLSGWAGLKVIYPTVSSVEKKLSEPNVKESYRKILCDLKRYHEKHGDTTERRPFQTESVNAADPTIVSDPSRTRAVGPSSCASSGTPSFPVEGK